MFDLLGWAGVAIFVALCVRELVLDLRNPLRRREKRP